VKNRLAVATISLAAMAFFGSGCAKKKVAATPPSTPAPAEARQSTQTQTQASTTPTPGRTPQPASTPSNQSRVPDAATRARIETLLSKIEDAYFDYDQHSLRPDAVKALQADSTELRDIIVQYPDYRLTIEGYCDERGSEAYNLALGDKRAESAKDYLVNVGIPSDQLTVKSFGKDKPICDEHDEACWQKNRRIHIVASAKN
jgi:peptidoglycan-associated lipoprotein